MHAILAKIILTAILFAEPAPRAGLSSGTTTEVDLQLVLAADISGSVNRKLRTAQRQGFAKAFRDPALLKAVESGPLGRIAVIYFEWAGESDQRIVLPWTFLSGPADMARFADALEAAAPENGGGETSISAAMIFAQDLFATSSYHSQRKVVDISGNGENSAGPAIASALSGLRAGGVIVNGLVLPGPAADERGPYSKLFAGYETSIIDYYRDEVIGGPGAFAIATDPAAGFGSAILRKLVLEIAWAGIPDEWQ